MGFFSMKQHQPAKDTVSVGKVQGVGARECQQDCFAVRGSDWNQTGMMAVVADGMGGLVNSGQISTSVVQSMNDCFQPGADVPDLDQLLAMTGEAIGQARFLTENLSYKSGTTLIACILHRKGLSWMSIGDSRLCLWRGGSMIQLNRDHAFSHDLFVMAINGQITAEQARANPRREALTSHIGAEFPRHFDFNQEPVPLLPGDRVVLMSDGVYRGLSLQELNGFLEKPADKCAELIKRRIEEKGIPLQDNFTAVILELQ